ncbi:winged helix-turn-helix domain-containing protein [Chromobacterium sinusclupearum]|uniref:winged helix-turn-helix domain-containing protein n=1 Tax=Chromobacterium sinusclupearum TaxID=2077146 RepID=UPI0011AED070|nr:hypothetical protein [Chromobacterium sinusclupearum]
MYYLIENGRAIFCARTGTIRLKEGDTYSLKKTEALLLECLLNKIEGKRQIMDTVWPSVIVTDNSYHRLIFDLRRQFSLIGLDQHNIKTIPRRGCIYTGSSTVFHNEADACASWTLAFNSNLPIAPYTKSESQGDSPQLDEFSKELIVFHEEKLPCNWFAMLSIIIFILGCGFGAGLILAKNLIFFHPVSFRENIWLVNTDNAPRKFNDSKESLIFFTNNPRAESYFLCPEKSELAPSLKKQETCKDYTYFH